MNDGNQKYDQLSQKLENLLQQQNEFSREILALQQEINKLKAGDSSADQPQQGISKREPPLTLTEFRKRAKKEQEAHRQQAHIRSKGQKKPKQRSEVSKDLEKFIGEKLISKIGIGITVIGVAIGAKYSIDHNLISPTTRIILGYVMSLAILGIGIKLKSKYIDFSAVLVSGAMAIMYFMTFAAYSFYNLFPQYVAFGLMVMFTVITSYIAISYAKQVIAIIGLVGAYAVPFLLSDGSENVVVLFTYMAIINLGILAIAFKKYWEPLYYSAFALTWLIFVSWYGPGYDSQLHFWQALFFAFLFFTIFYTTTLIFKIKSGQKFEMGDILILLANASIFYALGYSILASNEESEHLLGSFTLFNALLHMGVSAFIYRQKLADKNLLRLVVGMALVFITIAVPVQLNGNWVTLFWVGEATLLFWLGRTRQTALYELLSYPMMILAFASLLEDLSLVQHVYNPEIPNTRVFPLFNITFLTSLFFIAGFSFINYLNQKESVVLPIIRKQDLSFFTKWVVPAMLLISVYAAFWVEVATYWNQVYLDSLTFELEENQDNFGPIIYSAVHIFKSIWLLIYSLVFLTLLSFLNINKIKSSSLSSVNLVLNVIAILVFLTHGLYLLSELREVYLNETLQSNMFFLGIRYVTIGAGAALVFASYRYTKQDFIARDLTIPFDFLLHITVLWVASSELISYLDMAGSNQSYKLGLSILWGVYALFLIAIGIRFKKKYLRIGAIGLLGITLVKLFFYDVSDLGTIEKTILFVSLGVLLLIVSFLYNKFKNSIADE